MANVYTRIGYIKGATGAQGAQGAKGDTGDAATIEVGTVTTVPYGQTASVVNSGTSGAAVFDFTIPQGRPGQETTDMQNLVIGAITTSSASFPVPTVGETGKVLWGKVVKWFSDMSALVATKLNIANVVNNLATTSEGYALDARQGKALNDKIMAVGVRPTPNTTYVESNNVFVLQVGNIVIVNGRFHVHTEKPSGQSNALFTGLPHPQGGVSPVSCYILDTQSKPLIINADGYITGNTNIPVSWYNIFSAYSTN